MARGKLRLTLIHNDGAGDRNHSRAGLVDLLQRAGYDVAGFGASDEEIARALDRPAALVAIAGGDGTVASVVAQARPDGPPLAVLPLGTANNIARSFGLDRPLADLAAGWVARRTRPFYAIDATGPWGRRRIAEGIGFGAIEQAIATMPHKPSLARARMTMAERVRSAAAEYLELRLAKETIPGPFAALEICTIPFVGPNLPLAAAAEPCDRRFAICFICDGRDEREALAQWLAAPEAGDAAPVSIRAAERATIAGRFRRVRLDGHVWQRGGRNGEDPGTVTLASEAEPLQFLVPA